MTSKKDIRSSESVRIRILAQNILFEKGNTTTALDGRTIISFRAEAQMDFDELLRLALKAKLRVSVLEVQKQEYWGGELPVCLVVDCAFEKFRGLAGKVWDGHVMVETMRNCLLCDNSLERRQEEGIA